jgi:iron(III) transport system ATP-binding protein
MAGITLERVSKRFTAAGPPAVDGVSLEIASGEILSLLGPSGCGKTTTLRMIAGFETPDHGRIVVGGRTVHDEAVTLAPEDRRIGFVFQDYALFPHLTLVQNLAFGLRRLPADERSGRVAQVVSLCSLSGLEARYPHELSGGQQQRAALARAMAPGHDVVLLDEPLSSIDATLRGELRGELRRLLKRAGITAVLVTHDQEEALEMSERVAVMHQGRVEQVGSPREVYTEPATPFVARFVGDAHALPGEVTDAGVACELGVLATANACAVRAVDVMVRPSQLEVLPGAASATLVDRIFKGVRELYRVRLASGRELVAAAGGAADVGPGSPIGIRVRGPVSIFPREQA